MSQTATDRTGAAGRQQVRRRLQLIMLALMFLAPVIAAWVVWNYVGEHGVGTTANVGQLVTPARPLQPLALAAIDGEPVAGDLLRGRWTVVMFAPAGCDAACEGRLLETRQVRLSLNKDVPRVQRLLLLDAPLGDLQRLAMRQSHPNLVIGVARAGEWLRLIGPFAAVAPTDGSHVFLVDPLGNLMMVYGPDAPPAGMLKDLRKLLKISQIG